MRLRKCCPVSPSLRSLALLLALALSGGWIGSAARAEPARSSTALIRTMDLNDTVAWYRDMLGFRVVSDVTRVQARAVVLERSGFLLEVTEDERTAATASAGDSDVEATGSANGPAVHYLVSDVDAEIGRLRARGVDILAEPGDDLDGRFRVALIHDYGGRLVELREPLGDFHSGER
jgi:catechol 2,3-dioxygenase-like lactoylglutathione lyase family enzyme